MPLLQSKIIAINVIADGIPRIFDLGLLSRSKVFSKFFNLENRNVAIAMVDTKVNSVIALRWANTCSSRVLPANVYRKYSFDILA